ncbi:MAG: efflux RND transporter permease subunit [Phycisphaerae bacterium]|nr:efflux RND transporter permease subunit [Phycisphaerae bacterium]
MNLSGVSVRRPVMTLMVFLGVILVGVFCLVQMPIDLFPEMDIPSITVLTPYEGAGPEEIEEKITQPLEERLATVEDIKHIMSTSREGLSTIRLQFDWETDLDTRANDVRDAIDLARQDVPDEADDSRVYKLDVSQFPILVYGVMAQESYENLEDILDDEVANPLESIPGVGAVQVITPLKRQVNVNLDRERLASCDLTPDDIVRAIAAENRETSAGSIKMGETDYLPRVPMEFDAVEPMNDIVVRADENGTVRIRDLGRARDGFKDVELSVRIDNDPGAILLVQKQSEANTVEVARAVEERLAEITAGRRLPPDVRIVNVMDSSEDIEMMVADLVQTLIIGGALAMLAVFVFLRQSTGTLVIGLTIPFALIASGTVMYVLDYSINMMTLFALIVSLGMVVDNAIVVLENIARHREVGETAAEGATFGASEVGLAIIASTLTTLCIFFPLLFVKGVSKILFRPFAIVAAVVLLASLFTALTMTPMLASRLLKRGYGQQRRRGRFFRVTEAGFNRLADAYSRLLGWCLGHRAVVILIVVGLFAGSLALVPAIGFEFMPKEDRALVRGTVELPVGTRVERTSEALEVIYNEIRQEIPDDQIRAVFTRCGVSESGFQSNEGTHIGTFGVKLVPKGQRDRHVVAIADALRRRLERLAARESLVKYSLDLNDPMGDMIMGGEQPLSVNILGDNLEVTDAYAARLKEKIENAPGTVDISVSREKGAPELWVNVDRAKASSLGLNASDVTKTVRTSVYGTVAGKYRVAGDEYDIRVRLREADRARLEDLGHLPLRLPTGALTRVDNVGECARRRGPVEIERKDQRRIVRVGGDVHGRSLGDVMTDVQEVIDDSDIPPGVDVVLGGQSEDIRESYFWLTLALGVGAVLVYMVMASQFESLVDPFVVAFAVPFAFMGAIWGLYLGGYTLNIIVFLGLLLLIGVVVNNAIVLVDYINILRARGQGMMEAVQEAGRTRLRPVLMTAMTTLVALTPMAFKQGQGSEIWNPLGVTILGGLLVSTAVTLVLVPTIYSIFEGRVRGRAKR